MCSTILTDIDSNQSRSTKKNKNVDDYNFRCYDAFVIGVL